MPRKPKIEKEVVTVVVDGKPIKAVLHPPTQSRKSWYVYWNGLVASKSTGQSDLKEAIKVVEGMLRSGGKRTSMTDAILSDEEFEEVQKVHYARKKSLEAQKRAGKSLQSCLEAIHAFKVISGLEVITTATPDDCATFQTKALTLPKNTLRPYPNGNKEPGCYSPNTVIKWSVALQAAWERVCKHGGKKCVRGVVAEAKLLKDNPWKQFPWIEGFDKPIRQFNSDELLSLLTHLKTEWPGVVVAELFAKVLLWSCGRRAEISSLTWNQLRQVGPEYHFQIVGKWAVTRWFRIPQALYDDLVQIRTESPFVFAAYGDQLRRFYQTSSRPGTAKVVRSGFDPVCLGDWFHERIKEWSKTLPDGQASTHVFRKTGLQYALSGERISQDVAADVGVSQGVLMTHYVEERDPERRMASNNTFRRILSSLSPPVAQVYGHTQPAEEPLRNQLKQAMVSENWGLVAKLSSELAKEEQTSGSQKP
jgi:hypothetical protein